ncbi:MAG: hypothetical protein ABH887_02380 [bacterium]
MFKKFITIFLAIVVAFTLSCSVTLAQEGDVVLEDETTSEVIDATVVDELTIKAEVDMEMDEELEITAEELGLSEPGPFSWLKNVGWDIQSFFTNDPIKKSELKLKKAGNQMLRARQLVKADPTGDQLQSRLETINQSYEKTLDDIDARVQAFREQNPDNVRAKDFVDKYVDQRIKHQEILGRLENRVPEQVMEKMRANREDHLQKFGEVMNKLQSKEEVKTQLQNMLENKETTVERRAQHLEIIENLKEQVTPEIREKINELRIESSDAIRELQIKQQEINTTRQQLHKTIQDEREQLRVNIQQRVNQ